MSVTLRRDALHSRKNDLRQVRRAHRSQAASLRAVTRLVAKNNNLTDLTNFHFDAETSPPSDSEEASWLKSIDLDGGHTFDEASIPLPTTTSHDGLTIDTKHNRPPSDSAAPSTPITHPVELTSKADPTATLDISTSTEPLTGGVAQKRSRASSEDVGDLAVPTTRARHAAQRRDASVASPAKIAQLEADDGASLDDATEQLLDLDTPERPTKVVRLTTADDDQRATGKENGRRRSDASEPAKASRNNLGAQGEAASSPSSTVGAYSAATPMPPQDSPDTSPNSETGEQIEILPPKELRPSPEEQRQKEEHDRLLEAQKEIARRQALGDVSSTPDDQLRWEEREAAARAAEERAAREAVGGPEPTAKRTTEQTEAEEVVEEVMRDRESQEAEISQPAEGDAKATTQLPSKEGRSESVAALEDGDNITVATRNRSALKIDTSPIQPISTTEFATQQTPDEPGHPITTRSSSGPLQKRRASTSIGRPPSQAASSGDLVTTPGIISPTALRHPPDTPLQQPMATFETPKRPHKQSDLPRTPSDCNRVLEDLAALKGAAEDPDRDYLEPLFRIQAHETPAGRTTSLTELIRSASKTLTTADHFTMIQERLDCRELRRIYHLQNANKWSLRQMDRCNEPDQPLTHHDHMMAEMKFMRKDFKAERKMKTSICAWLARRCADWVGASPAERKEMQVRVKQSQQKESPAEEIEDQPPELEHSGESAGEEENGPPTPTATSALPTTIVVPPELSAMVTSLQKEGKLARAMNTLPVFKFTGTIKLPDRRALTPVSKFVKGKVLPVSKKPMRKRSRYDYDDAEEDGPATKRARAEEPDLCPEDQESALFDPNNKHIRDRLHANNAFRPPSEFVMPSTQFYEYRSMSQWICEDDMRLRKLAKEYSFNWSLIADELQTPSAVKSSAERRTPWECFERWVELEQLPSEMKKTVYFKTWYQRLEQSQQAAERRYQAQVAALQAQTNNTQAHVPVRRRTVPTRVDKRRATRYLWMVDGMRKGARKREQTAFKQAEAQRAAAARKPQADANQTRAPMLTPQEFSKKRHERDVQEAQLRRLAMEQQAKAKLDTQKQMAQLARQQQAGLQPGQQQGMPNGAPNQQRPGSSSNAASQQQSGHPAQQAIMNGQMQHPGRSQVPVAQRNGHLAVPQMNGQGMPHAQMRPNGQMPTAQDMQRMAHANAQRSAGYAGQQQYPMQSPGGTAMTAQQQMASNQAILANLQQQMNGAGQHQGSQMPNQQMSASPSMPPPPTPQQQQGHPQSLSSGHIPAVMSIKAQIRAKFPNSTEDQVNAMATEMLKTQSQSQSSNQARISAMQAAAGPMGSGGGVAPSAHNANMQAYAHNQAAYQNAVNQVPNRNYAVNGDMSAQQQQQQAGSTTSSSPQQHYANLMHQRTQAQFQQQIRQPGPATLNGSPGMAHASPNMTPASPSMQYANPGMAGQMPSMNMQGMPARPGSRGATPGQMQRLGSSGSVNGVGSPGQMGQGSPRAQAGVAR